MRSSDTALVQSGLNCAWPALGTDKPCRGRNKYAYNLHVTCISSVQSGLTSQLGMQDLQQRAEAKVTGLTEQIAVLRDQIASLQARPALALSSCALTITVLSELPTPNLGSPCGTLAPSSCFSCASVEGFCVHVGTVQLCSRKCPDTAGGQQAADGAEAGDRVAADDSAGGPLWAGCRAGACP